MGFFDSFAKGFKEIENSGQPKEEYYVVCPNCDKKIKVIGRHGEIKCPDCGRFYQYE